MNKKILIICGVSGTGKSTIGALVASALKLPFYDADDFHSESNVQKMQEGFALDDNDRQPWLDTLSNKIIEWEEQGAVLACSALKASYRTTLASKCKNEITWIFLHGSRELLSERLTSRKGHFLDSRLLDSQLSTLQLPHNGWVIDIQPSPDEIVASILKQLPNN